MLEHVMLGEGKLESYWTRTSHLQGHHRLPYLEGQEALL